MSGNESYQKQMSKVRFALVSQLSMLFLNLYFHILLKGFYKGKN